MKKPELLSPAGSMDSLIAGVQAGCDAVYLSGKKYGARSFASNFSDSELIDAVNYCHLYGVKVYVTVNTIIYEDEVNDFISYIDFLHSNSVDAIIMQDIGMVDLVRKMYPNLEIHISTQMNVHNLEGVKFFESLGIGRVVLARETSLDVIKKIKKNCSVDIEVFVHGALCISYSGQCLMSSLIGGRSGNRGACAGCCRLPYDLISDGKVINKDKYLISTKDLMTLDNIGELIDAGIESFKIEGRMKRPEYVFCIVSLYRKAIDSYLKNGYVDINDSDIDDMKKIFNRGFTNGYLFNEKFIVNSKRPNHMGVEIGKVVDYKNGFSFIKLSSDLHIHDGIRIVGCEDVGLCVDKLFVNNCDVISASSGSIVSFKCDFVKNGSVVLKTTDYVQINSINEKINSKLRKVFISGIIKLYSGNKIYLELSDGINKVCVSDFLVDKALNRAITRNDVIKQIDRLGGTVFSFQNLDVFMDDNVFVSISNLNEIRRRCINLLIEKRLYHIKYIKNNYSISVSDFSCTKLRSCLVDNIDDYDKLLHKYDYIYVDDYILYNKIDKSRNHVYYKIPRVNDNYIDIDSRVLACEYGSLYKYSNVDTDFSFNVVNSYSVAFLHSIGVNKVTLSHELDYYRIKSIIDNYHDRYGVHPNLEVIVSCYEEVMVSKFNLLDYYGVKSGKLRDRFGNLYLIKIKNDLMYLYNYKKRELDSNKLFEMGVNVVRFNI